MYSLLFGLTYYFLRPPFVSAIQMYSFILLTAFIGILALLALFTVIYDKTNFMHTRAANLLEHIGKSTLEIYLLHYFFIQFLTLIPLRQTIANLQNTVYAIPLYISMTLVVVLMCLLLNKTLKIVKVHRYIFPIIQRKHIDRNYSTTI